ncbi:MAG: lipocalin family protein [Bacteroidia bacterium]|nr:lipocalin family protein [Bacteroidia bacterium]
MITNLLFFSCKTNPPLQTVNHVDINRYMGKWYEIASFPQRFQKGCSCTTAEYELMPGNYVKVTNRCTRNGGVSEITGKAFVKKNSGNAWLKVQFFWPFKGDYLIIDLDSNYQYSVVGHPGRNYLWILSRQPVMNDSLYQEIEKRCREKGFDTEKLIRTSQI